MLKNRNFGLDVIRALSISLVVISHMFEYHKIEFGVWGVEVFFVLSGFLIGQILIKDFTNGITFKKIVHFWKRRWFRTLPLYYAVILIKFLFFDSSLGLKFFAYIFFLQNNIVGIQFLPVSWSLVVEEWFYITLPLLLFLFFRNGVAKEKLLYFLLVSLGILLAMRYCWVLYTDRPFEAIRPNFPFRFDSLLIGVLLAHLKVNYKSIYQKISNSLVCLAGLLIMTYLIIDLGPLIGQSSRANSYIWYRTGWFSAFSFSVFFVIPFAESSKTISKIAKFRFLFFVITWTSILTYSIYLIHLFVFKIMMPFESVVVNKILYISLIYLFSYLIYRYYEHPMMELRDKKINFFNK